MLAENLLEAIGFTEDQRATYQKYATVYGTEITPISSAFFAEKLSLADALVQVRLLHQDTVHEYTADLMFLLDCTGYVKERYRSAGIPDEIFIDTMTDIRYKLNECLRCKGIFGTFVAWWYDKFFTLERFALGRLQYDVEYYHGDALTVNGYTIQEGDFVLNCHIPSAGPLKQERCLESYRKAYRFFSDKLRTDVLPIFCYSWLLYPPYKEVFVEGTNTYSFVQDFHILLETESNSFGDAWRVFGTDSINDIQSLPTETAMQKRFVEYINKGGSFGDAKGVLLFRQIDENVFQVDKPTG